MPEPINQSQLESYLWGAATLLRGAIDAGDYKSFIFPLLFFKRISDIWDEEYAQALEKFDGDTQAAGFDENHRFQLPDGAHWSDVREATVDVGDAIQSAMRSIESANSDQLQGIFGDAQWTNKERFSDSALRDLIEHFSSEELTLERVPEDEFGQAYEYLVKRFADDSGHTAQEFYTNRTLVRLMARILDAKPGESVYDPTCGTGGMLLSTALEIRNQGLEHRNLRLYGQEMNLMTSSIARMNLFLHGISDFEIQRGDTLSDPRLLDGDQLRQFDVVLANPPYSIKQWDRSAFSADRFGRNTLGTPPQGRADYAFLQHILSSMDRETGRCAVLFPHGVLFRKEEREMRKRLVESDLVDCVLGLGPGLFYNAPMEACVLFCRTTKPFERKGKVLMVNAVEEYVRRDAQSFLSDENSARILEAYRGFKEIDNFSTVIDLDTIASNDYSLSLPLYVTPASDRSETVDLSTAIARWRGGAEDLRESADLVIRSLEEERAN